MKKLIIFLTLSMLSFSLSSCGLPMVNPTTDNIELQTSVAKSVENTLMAATLTAGVPTVTATVATPTIVPDTPTASLTPLPTFTPTMQGTWLKIMEETNCRSGPANEYDGQVLLPFGQLVEVMARNPENDYYYVRNPTNMGEYCWVWSKYTSLIGNTAFLPVFTAMPSPTPKISLTPTFTAANFTVSYDKLLSCSGSYGIQLYLENTGSVIWRSIRVILTDTTVNKTFIHELDTFRGTTADPCIIDVANEQGDLVNGEGSLVACINSGQFNYDPTGHSFTVSVTVFNNDGRSGTWAAKTITITP